MPLRTRTENTPETTENVTFKSHTPGPSYPDKTKTLLIPGVQYLKEKFWDESWNGSRKTWKDCEHYKMFHTDPSAKADPKPSHFVNDANSGGAHYHGSAKKAYARYRLYTYGGSTSEPFGASGSPISGITAFDQPNAIDGTFVPAPANLDNLNSMALKVMLPRIKEELSIINSIIELKDFKRLPDLIKQFASVVPLIRNGLRSGNPLRTFRDFLRLPASTYLTWEFAIAPLIDDICGVHAALAKFQAQIQNLISREGKMQTRHFSWKWREFPATQDELSPSGMLDQPGFILDDPAYTWKQYRIVETDASEFHAEIQYNYNYTEFQRVHALSLGLLDALGINFNTQIIWNALPWSFVVDWVVDVNRFLGQYGKVQNMEPVINIHQYLWSIKRKRTIKMFMQCSTNHPSVTDLYLTGSRVSLPEITETAYRRQTGIPGYSSLTSSGLSLKELSLGAALVSSRGRYRGPRSIKAPKPSGK